MNICAAQARPIKGDIESNIENHLKLITLAVSSEADVVIFPELSITGYDPESVIEFALEQDDSRLEIFQEISDTNQIIIGVGVPLRIEEDILISTFIFQPHKALEIYSKKYLHPDEEEYFVKGDGSAGLIKETTKIALAICYELSVPQHPEEVHNNGADVYFASVAKTGNEIEEASKNLSDIARNYSMTVLMSNGIGPFNGFDYGGRTSIWDNEGKLVGQLNDKKEGIVLIDTDAPKVRTQII